MSHKRKPNLHKDSVSTPEPDVTDDDHFPGRNGDMRLTDDREMSGDDVAGLWTGYHNALGLKKSTPPGAREQSSPLLLTQETCSVHDETSSSGNKEDEDDDEDEGEDKIDPHQYDPERLKAFNMFVRLFVDENLDRIVPISKQPKEKIQAIIDSCTRQFPEFAERARKRIRTYLKSCRRNKRSRETNGAWDAVRTTRPTPAHLTSVQAEQILAQACENESHNAKRMRLGLEPVSQPLPLLPSTATDSRPSSMDHYSSPVVVASDASTKPTLSTTAAPTIKSEPPPLHPVDTGLSPAFNPAASVGVKNAVSSIDAMTKSVNTTASVGTAVNGNTTSSAAAPTALYRPNFSQAFQRAAATGPYTNPLFPTPPFGSGSMISNGPTDLSMKTKPLLSHKLNTAEMAAVRQLITGYRESAAFLLRSADELEQLLLQQQ
ncbi:nucleolar protein 4-like isoform X3 [Zootermopsis nevadensis]|uniref:nucleolar protein 4-like isoform X3 n=1 Tax=Zootermopsis nevadensis TaxID=136037 RepID=UPI000B8E6A1A|nr:nucleolar protein 4-like isoform X3 [Zootermopsis nevadensis]